MKINIAVLFGGNSVEHEISIISCMQAIENMDKTKYNLIPIYITKKLTMYSDISFTTVEPFIDFDEQKYKQVAFYKEEDATYVRQIKGLFNKLEYKVDVVFPIVHGTSVEDGALQGYLNMFDVPIVGPTVLSGAIGQDKAVMKDILTTHNVNQTKYVWVNDIEPLEDCLAKVKQEIGFPCIIKPASLGSSVGIEICKSEYELEQALITAFNYDNKVVIEQTLTNFEEYNISLFNDKSNIYFSAIEKILKEDEFLSYEHKYVNGNKKSGGKSLGMASLSREVPANISDELKEEIKKQAQISYRALNCNGLVRFDIIINNEGIVLINEVNNIPGSLSYYLWEATGLEYKDQLTKMIDQAMAKYYSNQKLIQSFDTNVLSMQKGSKC